MNHRKIWNAPYTAAISPGLILTAVLLLIPTGPIQSRPLHPIILIHGLYGSAHQFEDLEQDFEKYFGWKISRHAHLCVNRDPESSAIIDDVLLDPDSLSRPDPDCDVVAVNFFNYIDKEGNWKLYRLHFPSWSQGNASGITAQGAALGQFIPLWLQATGADRVTIIGHSMGGLAAREYLQRRTDSGTSAWWPDSTHHVARLITIGTPHLGSDMLDIKTHIIEQDVALRDLRYSPGNLHVGAPNPDLDTGVYLFGGREDRLPDCYYNRDVNGNGVVDTVAIPGINRFVDHIYRDNPKMPLPRDVDYRWIVAEALPGSDMIVRTDRQYLLEPGRKILTTRLHGWLFRETTDLEAFMTALDYPDEAWRAAEPKLDEPYEETLAHPESDRDRDWIVAPDPVEQLTVMVNQSGLEEITVQRNGQKQLVRTVQTDETVDIPVQSGDRIRFEGHGGKRGYRRPYSFRFR